MWPICHPWTVLGQDSYKPQTYLNMEDCLQILFMCVVCVGGVTSAVQFLSVISEYNNVVFHCQEVGHACESIMISDTFKNYTLTLLNILGYF